MGAYKREAGSSESEGRRYDYRSRAQNDAVVGRELWAKPHGSL